MTRFNEMIIQLAAWAEAQKGASDEEGQGLAEYGLILALVAVAVSGALIALRGQLNTTLNGVVSALSGA